MSLKEDLEDYMMIFEEPTYNKFINIFSNFFENEPIEYRSYEKSNFFISVHMVNKYNQVFFNVEIIDNNSKSYDYIYNFCLMVDTEQKVLMLKRYLDKNNVIEMGTDVGFFNEEYIERKFNEILDKYFLKDGKILKVKRIFKNATVLKYKKTKNHKKITVLNETEKVPVDIDMIPFINKLNEEKIFTISCCSGHKKSEEAYVFLYCLDSQIDYIKDMINSYFKTENLRTEELTEFTHSKYWPVNKDGSRALVLRWKILKVLIK